MSVEGTLQSAEETDMDDKVLTDKRQQENMTQEGCVLHESSSGHKDLKSEIQVIDMVNTSKEVNQSCHSLDSPEHFKSQRIIQTDNREISQSNPSSSSKSRVSATSLALVSSPEVLSTTYASGIAEKYSLYQVKRDQELGLVTSPSMATTESNQIEDVPEQIPKTIPENNQSQVTPGDGGAQNSGSEVFKSLSSMDILYNTARGTFQTQPQTAVSSMDVLYTVATASQQDSGMMNTVPGIDVLYTRAHQLMPQMSNSVSTSSGLHNTTEAVMCEILPPQQSPDPRAVVTSSTEYSIDETSLQSKVHNVSYDSNAYEKFKHVAAQIGVSSSDVRFPLSSSSILPSSETHALTRSSYYSPQTVVCSDSDRGTDNRDEKQIGRLVEPNIHLEYYVTNLAGEISRESLASNLHPEGKNYQTGKDYGRISVPLPSMNPVPFMEGYHRYRSKAGLNETHTQVFSDYHHGDDNSQQQKLVSVTEMGPAQFGFNIQHEKVSGSNLMHIPEVHGRFAYHQNGQIALNHAFDSGKGTPLLPEFHQRDASQMQQNFYPKVSNCDSSVMYMRPDMQKCQTQVYQELIQGSHVAYFQTDGKTSFEPPMFPAGHMFGFHQISPATVESQHISHEKDSFSRLENLEKLETLKSNQEVCETNSDVLDKCNETTEDNNVIADTLSSSKSEQQIPSSKQEAVYDGPCALQSPQCTDPHLIRRSVALTDASSVRSYEQPNTHKHYLQTGSYGEYAMESQEKDINTGHNNIPDRSVMSSIKMKINAILESNSLQFDESVQQQSSVQNKDSLSDKNRLLSDNGSLTDNSLKVSDIDNEGRQSADENTHGMLLKGEKSICNKSSKISVFDNVNDGFRNNSDSVTMRSTDPGKPAKTVDKKLSLLNVSENIGNGKKRSRNLKDSKNCDANLSSTSKVKKEASVSNNKNILNIDTTEVKTATVSLNNGERILKENIPQYKCEMCHKEFSQLCTFQRHLRFHNGQPLFTCDLCEQGFNDLFSFVDHITEVGSEKLKQLKTIPELVNFVKKPPSLTNKECVKSKRFNKTKFRRSKCLKRNNKSVVLKGTVNKDDSETIDGDVEDEPCAMENEEVDEESVNMEEVEDKVKEEDDEELRVKNFKCNECGMQFSYARYLSAHLLTHSDQKSFRCEICSKEFSHGHSLNRHRKKVHPKVVVHSCNICGEGFNRFVDLKEHSNCHLADSSLKCKMCDQEFSCQRDLQLHVSSHTGGKAFQCDLCWKQFTQYCTLLRHKRRFDHSGGPPYKCKWCAEGFYEMGKLLSHSRKHMGSGPHKCDVCGKGFATTNNLKVHKSSVHSSEKPFCCDLCGDQFTRVSYLRQHIKTHSGDRPYVCELCGKGFGMQDTLSKHMRTHTGEKPYSCDQCGKQFSLTATLTVHKRTHTGERPYVCDVCGKGFIDNSSWNKHIKHHHKSSGGRENTLDNTADAKEDTSNNFKTFNNSETSVSTACLAKATLGESRQIQMEGHFLTSQMTVNGDVIHCTSSY